MAFAERREQTKRSFRGELRGEILVNFLRNESDNQSRAAVLSLITDLRELMRHAERTHDGLFRVYQSKEFGEARERFNGKVERYKLVNAFSIHPGDKWHFTQTFTGSREESLAEFEAVHNLIRLASDGLLDRVRQCEFCKDWLFARFPHQKCCGAPRDCRIKLYHSSEEYKQKNREQAKKAYEE